MADMALKRQFALKKIRCPTGSDAVKEAMREVEAYRRFRFVIHKLCCEDAVAY